MKAGFSKSEFKRRLKTVELLHIAKEVYTYAELERIVGVPAASLRKYKICCVRPSIERAVYLNRALLRMMPGYEAEKRKARRLYIKMLSESKTMQRIERGEPWE